MEYIKIENDIVKGHYMGNMPTEQTEGVEYRPVKGYAGGRGVNLGMLDEHLRLKPMEILVKEGWVKIPKGKKYDSDKGYFVDLNDREKVETGIRELKPEEKIDGDYIVQKSIDELYKDKLISSDQYNEYIDQQREAAYRFEADPLGMQVMRGELEKEDWLKVIKSIKDRYPKVK